jgi:hypothetical protein
MAQRATATCYCGAVQLEVVSSSRLDFTDVFDTCIGRTDTRQPVEGDGLVNTHVCHCKDCRKVTATMFASNVRSTSQSSTLTQNLTTDNIHQ